MDVCEERAGEVTVLRLTGRIDSAAAPELGLALLRVLLDARRRIVLDLRAAEHLSGPGLRVLLMAARRIAQARGTLVLQGPSDKLRQVIRISGFGSAFTLCDARDEALALARQ